MKNKNIFNADYLKTCLTELSFTSKRKDWASILGVTTRTIDRYLNGGKIPVAAFHAVEAKLKLKRCGIPWRNDQMLIGIDAKGKIVELSPDKIKDLIQKDLETLGIEIVE